MGKRLIKVGILLKQNWYVFFIFLGWFFVNYVVFYALTARDHLEALWITFYFKTLPESISLYGNFYPIISEFVIFGVIFSVITTGFFRKYNPKQTCINYARSLKNHAVIIGYSHLGRRLRRFLYKNNIECVIIEENENLVKHLIELESPVIIRKPYNINILKDANIQAAKLVFTTKNDLETLIVSTSLTRQLNTSCKIVCRCFDDSVAEILEKKIRCKTISTSKYARDHILNEVKKLNVKSTIIIGYTNLTIRLMFAFSSLGIKYTIIEKDKNKVLDIIDDQPVIVGDAKDKENLREAGIDDIDMVIALIDVADEILLIADIIRELNQDCHLMCRFFHEEVGNVLEQHFNAKVISQSKNALKNLIKEGFFEFYSEHDNYYSFSD
ncbi:MAG: hypothetical protein GF329_11930 [Candidatus Lokiarchaeota archaeon]|nr:hypothetical protein [Candidatus Lokiarchaeota archaeon]